MRKEKINKFNFLFTVYNSRYYTYYILIIYNKYYYVYFCVNAKIK